MELSHNAISVSVDGEKEACGGHTRTAVSYDDRSQEMRLDTCGFARHAILILRRSPLDNTARHSDQDI
jgi:hypothetical protein